MEKDMMRSLMDNQQAINNANLEVRTAIHKRDQLDAKRKKMERELLAAEGFELFAGCEVFSGYRQHPQSGYYLTVIHTEVIWEGGMFSCFKSFEEEYREREEKKTVLFEKYVPCKTVQMPHIKEMEIER